ncbi:outer membrane protein assembly factor BamB family protein [Dictyobacter kobayashii]|uniref:Pyrrolo-quinoline quinone repeat domain-containing protein n=1 Tax=Dictyobacter kobayashii TaxID=2014872 RepID=A0A402AKS6_9CHLR|nr:PQQ-binding-like beta-propeller repeat protein [Dictyobacter kobayashii]GCE19828.1 hypothetical protein KDK_36280 [Dictyobacter kobayashii]
MREPEPDDLAASEFEIVDLDSLDEGRSGARPRLLQGQHFSGRGRFLLSALTLLGVGVVLVLLWPDVALLFPRPVTRVPSPLATSTNAGGQQAPPLLTMLTWGGITVMKAAPGYNADHGRVSAFDTATGHLLWRTTQDVRDFGVADGKVYLHKLDDTLHVLDVRNGTQLWQRKLGSGAAVAAQADGLLLVVSNDGTLVAYRLNDGGIAWSRPNSGWLLQADAGLVYTFISGTTGGTLFAFHVSDGRLFQSYAISSGPPRDIIVQQGIIYTVRNDLVMTAVRVADRSLLWERPLEQNASLARIAAGRIYFNVYDQGLNNWIDVWNATDGRSLWRYQYGYAAFSDVQNGIVYVSAHTSISALRASDGHLLWHSPSTFSDPDIQVSDGSLYINSLTNGIVIALNARNGQTRWSYNIAANDGPQLDVLGFVAHVENGIVYVVSMHDFSLKAIRASDRFFLWGMHLSINP